jgi:hypothetical protein
MNLFLLLFIILSSTLRGSHAHLSLRMSIRKGKKLTSISSEAQKAQMNSLNHAFHRRQLVEIDIWKQLKALEKSRKALAKLLIEVCQARLETTAEIGTTGRVPEKAPKLVCNGLILYECGDADGQSSDQRRPERNCQPISHNSILLYKLCYIH